jgi:hypothetical protein
VKAEFEPSETGAKGKAGDVISLGRKGLGM